MAKKPKSKSHPNKVYQAYKVEGDSLKRLKKTCPKCGQGVFLAEHKDRVVCGKCGYTEFSGKEGKPKEGKPEGKEEKPREEVKPEAKEKPAEKKEKSKEEKPKGM